MKIIKTLSPHKKKKQENLWIFKLAFIQVNLFKTNKILMILTNKKIFNH